jgi:hypothetical protein
MDPAAIEAIWVTGRNCAAVCAKDAGGRQSSTRPPTTADAVILELVLMNAPALLRYEGMTVKTISRVNVLFAILSVILISRR